MKGTTRLERGHSVIDGTISKVLSVHRSRAAVVDTWREAHSGIAVGSSERMALVTRT